MQIYLGRDGQRDGPFTLDEVRARLAQGTARPDDLAWYEGAAGWLPVHQVPGLNAPAATPFGGPPPIPSFTAFPATMPGSAQPQEPLALASLILGILGLVMIPIVTSIAGIVCGHLALGRIKRAAGALGGRGLAIGGLITSYLGMLIFAVGAALVVWFFAALSQGTHSWSDQISSSIEESTTAVSGHVVFGACVDYAEAHEGAFPATLEALVPEFLPKADVLKTVVGEDPTRGGFVYFGGNTSDPDDRVLFQSRGRLPDGRRVVARVNGEVGLENVPDAGPLENPRTPENSSKEP